MTLNGWIQIAVYCAVVIALVKPLGGYMTRVFNGERTLLSFAFGPLERGIYRVAGTSERAEQHWTTYVFAMLAFNLAGILLLYVMQRAQGVLPFNPQGLPGLSPELSFNTAVSFVTNTNWQAYGGEGTMSYFTQMSGLAVQNFLSAATGMAIAIAVVRGFSRKSAKTLGNFWVDMTRSVLYILLPVCVIGTLVLVWQ